MQRPGATLFLATALLSGLASASDRPARNVQRPNLPFTLDPQEQKTDAVIVKFVDAIPVRLAEGQWTGRDAGADLLLPYRELLDGARVERLFSREVTDLERERAALLPRVPDDRPLPADLNQYYRVRTSGIADSERLVNELNRMDLVETAYAEPGLIIMAGGDIPPTTALFESGQTYKDSAPLGVGFNACRNIVGARGPDLSVGHLEGAWNLGHEDACNMVAGNIVGSVPGASWSGWRAHGDACVGILNADRNLYGTRGMNDAAALILSSLESGSANMISLVTAAASAGDVMESSWVFGVNGVHAPLDYFQAEFDAVEVMVLSGISYCYSAGNTDANLEDTGLYGTRYLPGSPDSGGVIVGAGNSSDLDKISFSNYGSRVDCHAWGENITTLGYGGLFDPGDVLQRYTSGFGGTSGAAPIVAGVAAAISNIQLEQNGVQLTALQIRDMLRTMGTPQGSGGNVGPRPDLKDMLQSLGLPDGLNVQGDGEIGQSITLDVNGEAGQLFLLLIAEDRGSASVGLNRNLLLDLGTLVIGPGGVFDGSGQASLTGPVPNIPALMDKSFFIQSADLLSGGAKHLSNSVELWIQG